MNFGSIFFTKFFQSVITFSKVDLIAKKKSKLIKFVEPVDLDFERLADSAFVNIICGLNA